MRKFGFLLILLILFIGGLFWYVYPQEKLDLSYSSFGWSDKLKEMITSRRLEFHLTQSDIDQLIKKEIALHPNVNNQLKITGTRIELKKDLLIAHVNMMYQNWLPIGTNAYYRLTWEAPQLIATPLYSKVRNWKVPTSLIPLPAREVPIGSMLPRFLSVQEVSFKEDSISVFLRFT